jgi:hypothetical protein
MHWHFNDSLPEPPAWQPEFPLCVLEEALTASVPVVDSDGSDLALAARAAT